MHPASHVVTVLSLASTLLAQNTIPQNKARQERLSFDVVSIRPYEGVNDLIYVRTSPGGLVTMEGQTVMYMITSAYGVRQYQVENYPDWLMSERYNIVARAEGIDGPFRMDEMWPRVRTMLADRFALKIRQETREMPIYALVVNKGGPKLKPSESTDPRYRAAKGMISTARSSIGNLAAILSQQTGRPVIDDTGIQGNYQFTLTWSDPGATSPEELKVAAVAGRSLFTAVQEELGLRLESRREPVEMLVVEHVEKASAN